MIWAILLLLIGGVLIAALFTYIVNKKILKKNIQSFLDIRKQTTLSQLNNFLATIGRGQQADLEKKLVDAGIYNQKLAKYYLPAKFATLLITGLIIALTNMELTNKGLVGALCLIAILVVPDMFLDLKKKAVAKKTSRQLPYMLDMMAVCIQTGMTIEASLGYLSKELMAFDKDLCYHIRKTADAAKVQGLEKALYDFGDRLPTPEVQSFIFTLIQNLQYGTSIANVLSSLAEDMRKMHVLAMEEKIGKLSAKMSIPLILLIMFPIVILILAPGIMQMSLDIVN
ncbi:type II secretion system F family protein [Photobacterium sp. SDRW27]|uniref:type II secretion system F family protein n=1 Tax=Photobacterium obscurum TaxID=2829490 RepID=UPI0022446820|nr:type II secretion system F family protein [Photobacterium obscurum]MCW8327421.1 type II secretion system F family protein [Photobacterium obscurum]